MKPITRIEKYLAVIASDDDAAGLPTSPVRRVEYYLAKIAGEDVQIPWPVTRIEKYLANIAGENVEIPSPVTRAEKFLYAIAGGDVETPYPITRVETYLAAWAEQSGSTIITATGLSPLALANAIAHSIKSITQYGKCVQASTPTPSSPVDIKCNNGALKMVDDELPSGYKRLLGLTFNNNAYYPITGFKMRGSDTLRFSFKCSMQTPACNVLGAYDGTSAQSNYSLYLGNSTSAKYLRYNGGAYRSDADSDTQYDVVITPTGATGMKADSSWTAKTFESDGVLCIGTTSPTATSSKMVGDIIGNIVVDGRLKLIPSERVSDNVLGYYDTVGETFYEPTGSGVVSMGYDGSHYELAVVGTPEVLSVAATGKTPQTASVQTLYAVGDNADEQDIISGLVTRKCGVKVLDGTETWAGSGGPPTSVLSNCYTLLEKLGDGSMTSRLVYCTHYKSSSTLPSANAREGFALLGNASSSTQGYEAGYYLGIGATTTYPNIEDFKSYLAEQYAAGTPVIVVYPLTEETTDQTASHSLRTAEGNNIVSVVSEVGEVELNVEYMGAE